MLFRSLSAGLEVVSTEASGVRQLLGDACTYLEEETPHALAEVMAARIRARGPTKTPPSLANFSIPSTALRLKVFFEKIFS